MLTVKHIAQAIEQLPTPDFKQLRDWFAEFSERTWDKQIEADATAGKLDFLAAEAMADYQRGAVRAL